MPGQQEAHRNSLNFCSGTCRLRGNDDRAPTRPRLWRPSTRSRRNFCEAAAMRQQVDSPDTSQEWVSCLTHTRLAEIVEVRILIPLFSVLRLCFRAVCRRPVLRASVYNPSWGIIVPHKRWAGVLWLCDGYKSHSASLWLWRDSPKFISPSWTLPVWTFELFPLENIFTTNTVVDKRRK